MSALLICVDDESQILSSLKRLLKGEPYEVQTFTSGAEALAFLRARARAGKEVVLTDFRMPGMNGGELLKILAEERPGAGRVVLSGYSDNATVEALRAEGVIQGLMAKPWEPEELKQALRGFFEGAGRSEGPEGR